MHLCSSRQQITQKEQHAHRIPNRVTIDVMLAILLIGASNALPHALPHALQNEAQKTDASEAVQREEGSIRAAAVKPTAPLAAAPAEPATLHAQVLVIVSDHGGGTTEFGLALEKHPCVFDLGEPFAAGSTGLVWSKNDVPECYPSTITKAIFDADSGTLVQKSNPILTDRIQSLGPHLDKNGIQKLGHKRAPFAPVGLTGDSPSLYNGLEYNFAEYFVRIRDLVCKGVPANVCPPADCTITLKLFPQFVNANTAGQYTKNLPPPSHCTDVRNEKAMTAWTDALKSMAQHPRVASITLTRNEVDRQFSVFHRFAATGLDFDCSLPRTPSTLATVSKDYTDLQIAVEDCWKGAEGADKCIGDALALVGLTAEPMAGAGTEVSMGGSNLKSGAEEAHFAASKSCSTDPSATFRRQPNDDVIVVPSYGSSQEDDVMRRVAELLVMF